MNAIERLEREWPPPAACCGKCSPALWNDVEKQIGVRPPPDFEQLLSTYGSGFVGLGDTDPHWLVVRSPRRESGYGNLVDAFRTATALFLQRKAEFPQFEPYPILPTPGGLFPFAHDSCGFEYYWLTKGTPESWPLVIDTDGEYIELRLSFADFLLHLVRGNPPHKSFDQTGGYEIIWTPDARVH
jgi:hypothetical protein